MVLPAGPAMRPTSPSAETHELLNERNEEMKEQMAGWRINEIDTRECCFRKVNVLVSKATFALSSLPSPPDEWISIIARKKF